MKRLFLMAIVICLISCYPPETSASGTLWHVAYYSDEFGEPTQEKFVTHRNYIRGTFSNSATQNSLLNVRFLIDKKGIAILLYEYAGNNPVKTYGNSLYDVLFKDKNGHCERYSLLHRGDRIWCPKTISLDGCKMHKALIRGGIIKFIIREEKYPINTYRFIIKGTILSPTTKYTKAYREAMEVGSYAKAYKKLLEP